MAETYTVQKGDTLSAIAKKLGVNVGDISGYKSGNPDLIYSGETLSVGSPSKNYSSEMSSQLNNLQETSKPKSIAQQVYGEAPSDGSDPYDIGKLRSESEGYKTKMNEAYDTLKTIKTETYNTEYASRGMDEKKKRISALDTEISSAKAERDAAINKIKQNPGLSAAQMTGQSKKIADYQNNVINNLIEQRNGAATEYNSELSEIDKMVGNKAGEAETAYNYYSGLLGNTQNRLQNYQTALTSELSSKQSQENWEKELAQALAIASQKGTAKNLKLVTDPYTGAPKYWYDSSTGEIIPLSGNEGTGEEDTNDIGDGSGGLFVSKTQPPAQNQSTGFIQSIINGVKNMFGGK